MTRTFAIGDIHGHYNELMQLMIMLQHEANLNFNKDIVVFLGDMVDGGPKTKQVIELLMKYEKAHPHWQFLYGNHEDLMMDALIGKQQKYGDFYIWFNQGGKATVDSYKKDLPYNEGLSDYERALIQPMDIIPIEHIDWIRQRPWWYEDENYFYTHGGLTPGHTIEQHKNSEPPVIKENMIWIREEFYNNQDYDWGKKIIFGHTPFEKVFNKNNKIGIDLMTRFGGSLCAVELPTEKFYYQESLHDPSW